MKVFLLALLVLPARAAAPRGKAPDSDKEAEVVLARARSELERGSPLDASNTLTQLPVLGYDRPDGHLLRAQAYLATGHGPEAFKHADRAAVLAPKEGKAYLFRSQARAALGEPWERVLEDCAKASSLEPALASACPAPPMAWSGGPGEARPPEGSWVGPYSAAFWLVAGALIIGFRRGRPL